MGYQTRFEKYPYCPAMVSRSYINEHFAKHDKVASKGRGMTMDVAKPKKLKCSYCRKTFDTYTSRNTHMIKDHREKRLSV